MKTGEFGVAALGAEPAVDILAWGTFERGMAHTPLKTMVATKYTGMVEQDLDAAPPAGCRAVIVIVYAELYQSTLVRAWT